MYFLDVNKNVQPNNLVDDDDGGDALHEMSVNVFIFYLGF